MSEVSRRALLRGGAAAGLVVVGGVGLARTAEAATYYNPFSGYAVTGTWADHLAQGSSGGIDYGMAVGTALPAAGAGTVTNIPDNGTGGHTVTIAHANGYRTQYMYLSAFVLGNGASIGMGGVVGRSGGAKGAPGSGSSTGPHCHWHMIDPSGRRINPLVYLSGGGGGGLPKTTTVTTGEPGPVFYSRAQRWLSIESGYTGPVNGVMGVNSWAAWQRNMRDHYGYAGPINGIMGVNGWAATQRLAARYGYTGPVNGVMGPNSYRGVARFLNEDRWD